MGFACFRCEASSPVSVGSQGSSTSQEPADFGDDGDQPKADGKEQVAKRMKMARVKEKVYRNTYLDGRLVREEIHHQCYLKPVNVAEYTVISSDGAQH